jgi:nicotinate phosphoribosyltransferase
MNNLFETSDLSLTQFASSFAQGSVWLEEGMDKQVATFDLVVREMSTNRNYLVYGGLEELVHYIRNLKYSKKQIRLLLDGKVITKKFAQYLESFRFSGDIYAMPEGTIFFPGEPIVRVTAPIIEASLIEIALFTITTSNVIFLSKAARIRMVSQDKGVTLGMQRGHSFESGMKGLRSGYICGLQTTGWPNFVQKYGLEQQREYLISGQHFYIKSFSSEIEAFGRLAEHFPANAGFMIDTYDIRQGVSNAITIAKELKARGDNLRFVTIDSGDLHELSCMVRSRLDENDLSEVKILAATNMNEYKIKKLLDIGAPIDSFILATEYVTVSDAPSLEVVYKLAELRYGRNIRYTAKMAPGKGSYPGKKQTFRKYRNGKMVGDTVGLEDEDFGAPLLKKYISKGRLIKKLPELDEIKEYFNRQLLELPEGLRDIENQQAYPVVMSKKIEALLAKLKKEHL